MKYFFILLTSLIFLSGCSSRNAFDEFKMDKDQELSISSLQSAKIISSDGKINGVFSAIYLNEVYPDSFNDGEYFFIYMYQKEPKELYDPKELKETGLSVKLNSKLPVKLKELPRENIFSHLISIKSDWNRYYILAFLKEKKENLNLVLESDPSSSADLKYQKGEQ